MIQLRRVTVSEGDQSFTIVAQQTTVGELLGKPGGYEDISRVPGLLANSGISPNDVRYGKLRLDLTSQGDKSPDFVRGVITGIFPQKKWWENFLLEFAEHNPTGIWGEDRELVVCRLV